MNKVLCWYSMAIYMSEVIGCSSLDGNIGYWYGMYGMCVLWSSRALLCCYTFPLKKKLLGPKAMVVFVLFEDFLAVC